MTTIRIPIRWKAICAVIVLVLGTVDGCTVAPKHVIWRAEAPWIGPQAKSFTQQGSSLLVETEGSASWTGDDRMTRDPFYVYSCARESGDCRLLDTYSNDIMTPITLVAGDYIVVARRKGTFRQVQVRIEEDRATVVSLSDLTHGVTP
jgi:hypothetical protein